jgi:hypothetical protein
LLKSIIVVNKDAEKKNVGFPYLNDLLKFYKENFDAEEAKREGSIITNFLKANLYEVVTLFLKSLTIIKF